ncbi:hypothetical protein HGO21_03365 [Acinetobacter sp. CUI P1]|nr:hypothetical protein [Acinetobacter sp. CUI P1]
MNILCSPHTEDIEKHLSSSVILENRILHLTPTLILYRRRIKFYAKKLYTVLRAENNSTQNKNIEEEIHKYIDLYEINKYMKTLKHNKPLKLLTSSEATVILERIIRENPHTNNPSWLSVLYDLYSLFSELSLTGLNLTELRSLETSKKWSQITELYEAYLNQLKTLNVVDQAISSRLALIDLDITPYNELILDGAFLPITPVLQLIIDKFIVQNKSITIFLPYDLEVPEHPALKSIKTIYDSYLPISDWRSIQEKKSKTYFINRLPKNIFRSESPTHLDASLEILRFNTLEDELTFIMQKIYVLIKHKEVSPKQIVIITPGAMKLRPLIREISEQYNLKVQLPKRPLMHLAQGRALRYLFDVYTDIRKECDTYFTSKMMKVFINDSLLLHSPSLFKAFEKIECFFEDCVSIADFNSQINSLLVSKELLDSKHEQHPLNGIDLSELHELKRVINTIYEISSSLINVSPKPIGEHIEDLLKTLKTNKYIKELSPVLWDRILNITDSVQAQRNLPISGSEFGARVSALFTEQEEFEPGEIPIDDENDIFLEKEILVTGPNNVEFQRYDYVFLCRFTQDVYPEPQKNNWAMSKEIEQQILQIKTKSNIRSPKDLETFYLDRSLYHVYLTMCAPSTQLTISYSQMDNGQPLSPSHYLHDIAKVFGIEEGNRLENKQEPSLESLLESEKALKIPTSIRALSGNVELDVADKKRDMLVRNFTAEDVAIFQYCQRRFYYQNKHPEENLYTQLFHLQSYASSCLYEKTIELFVASETFPLNESIDLKKQQHRLQENMISYRQAAEESIRAIFPFGNRQWHNVIAQTDFFLQSLLSSIFENQFVKQIRKQGNSAIKINISLSNRTEEIKIDDYIFTSIKELEVQYNNGEIHRYSISNRKDFLSFSTNDYDEKDFMEEVKQWYFNFKREFRSQSSMVMTALNEVVSTIKQGDFKKNTGGHCMYCTFNKICREREVDL